MLLILFLALHINLVSNFPAGDQEDDLLQGLNSYRRSKSLPALTKHDKAKCLADEIADKLEDQPCPRISGPNSVPTNPPQFSNYPNVLKKCKVDINNTKDGIILPVCVKNRVATLVLTNYTQTPFATYLNNSRFAGAGIGKEDDWTVVVLSANTRGGTLASAAGFACKVHWSNYYFVSLLGLILVLVN